MAVLNTACGTPYQRARYGPRVAAAAAAAALLLLLYALWHVERGAWHRLGEKNMMPTEAGDDPLRLHHHHLTFGKDHCLDLFTEGVENLPRREKLDLSRCGFTALPSRFPWEELRRMGELDASDNQLSALPDGMEGLPRLRILLLGWNRFVALPAVVRTLPALEVLGMQGNQLASLGEGELPRRLTQLLLSDNVLRALPDSVPRLPSLRRLALSGNALEQLPATLADIETLEALGLAGNRLRPQGGLPAELFKLPRLSWISVAANEWPLPVSILAVDVTMATNTRAAAVLAAGRVGAPKMEASRRIDAGATQVLLERELWPSAAAEQAGHMFANTAVPYVLYNGTIAGEPVLLKVYKSSAPARLAKEEALIHEWIGPHVNLEGVSAVVTHLNVSTAALAAVHKEIPTPNYKGGVQFYSTTHSGDSHDPSGADLGMQSTGLVMRRPTGMSPSSSPSSSRLAVDSPAVEKKRTYFEKHIITDGHHHKERVRSIADWSAGAVNGLRPLADHPTILKPLRPQYPHRRKFSMGFLLRVVHGVCHALEHLHKHKVSHSALAAHRVLVDGEQLTLREHGHEHDHIIEMSPTGPVILTDLSAAFSYANAVPSPAGTAVDSSGAAASADFERLEVRSFGLLLQQLYGRYDARRAIDDQGVVDTATKDRLELLSRTATSPIVALRPTFAELSSSLQAITDKALPESEWHQHTHETAASPWIAGR